MDNEKLLEILKSNSDESYTSFSTMLSNTSLKIIGVKIPKLKELAKIYKDEDLSNITKNEYWDTGSAITTIICSDGIINI